MILNKITFGAQVLIKIRLFQDLSTQAIRDGVLDLALHLPYLCTLTERLWPGQIQFSPGLSGLHNVPLSIYVHTDSPLDCCNTSFFRIKTVYSRYYANRKLN